MQSSGFGSGGAHGGGSVNIVETLRKPQTWIRMAGVLFAIIVFSALAANGRDFGVCAFNTKDSACDFGIAVGVIAFLALLSLLVIDFAMPAINQERIQKIFILVDFAFSAFMAFIWFICFCYLTNEWRVTSFYVPSSVRNAVQGAIAFCFFSICAWGALAVFGFMTVRNSGGFNVGYSNLEAGGGPAGGAGGGGASAPLNPDSSPYQEPPSGDVEKPVY